MSRKNDDSIETFFRKAVRQSDTTFRESDWLSMEKMLDEQARAHTAARARSIRRYATVASGILLLSVALYFFVPLSEHNKVQNAKSTFHGPQSTAENQQGTADGPQSTVHSPQPTVQDTRQADTQALQPDGSAQQPDNKGKISDSGTDQPDISIKHSDHPASRPGGKSAPTAAAQVQEITKKNGTTTTTAIPSHRRTDHNTVSEVQTATSQQRARQNIQASRKPRQPKPSESTAISVTTTQDPTVASAPELDAVSQYNNSPEKQNTLQPSAATAVSPPKTQHNSVPSEKEDRSETNQSITPATVELTTTPSGHEVKPAVLPPATTEKTTASEETPWAASPTEAPVPSGQGRVDRGLSTNSTDSTSIADTLQTDSITQKAQSEKEPPSETPEDDKPRIRSRWNVALVVAPDFSSTGLGGEMSTPGQAYGGMIGYRLSRKFTVTSGVFKTSKKYVGYGDDYQPPEGYWLRRTNGIVPSEIKGRCTIIEVPLIVQYDLRQGERSRLYVSGGVSSYFMRHESYDYDFDEPNDGADRGWSSSAPSSFLFKVGHLSVAYELMLVQRLGVGIEPFIKVPFQGIGWANISLYTTGAYVNVRYYLMRKSLK